MDKVEKLAVEKSVSEFCGSNGLLGEVSWKKTDQSQVERYKRVADLIHEHSQRDELLFKCLVLDKSKVSYKKHSGGDKGVGYYKFVYQLVVNSFCRYLQPYDKMMVRIDEYMVDYSLADLKRILNNGILKKYKAVIRRDEPVVSVEPRRSIDCRMTQVADLLTGAVRHSINLPYVERASSKTFEAKTELSRYILELFKVPGRELVAPFASSPISEHHFSIWHFKLRD